MNMPNKSLCLMDPWHKSIIASALVSSAKSVYWSLLKVAVVRALTHVLVKSDSWGLFDSSITIMMMRTL